MKVFRVYVKDFWYDEYDSAVIVAESEEVVRSSFVTNAYGERECMLDAEVPRLSFSKDQGEIYIEEIELT